MNIQIRVAEAQARRALQGIRNDIVMVDTAARNANRSSAQLGTGNNLTKWGSQVQWAGRQLMYNFTLPLAVAAGAATKFALDNEKAMVRVKKVYGDSSLGPELMRNELEALDGAFEALSNRFGVNQAEVINLGGEWAAAGASGIALAKATELTLRTMVLGELEAAEATTALISIQAQYGLSVEKLSDTIDTLNMTENETATTMKDLIESMQRSAGVAKTAGVDVLHLAAMTASLVPASGSAATAGNGLKTIMSRLLSPTKEAAEVMGLMGINTADMGWQSLTASQRLEAMAKKFSELDDAQKVVVSTTLASRYQINRFEVLMDDMVSATGRYQKTLRMAGDETANFNQAKAELNAVLESNPQKMKQMWVMLQNAMANVIQPLIPYIVALAQWVAEMATKFANMDPVLQKFVLLGLGVLAIIGPLGRYIGATAVLLGFLGSAFGAVARGSGAFLGLIGRLVALPFRALWASLSLIGIAVRGIGTAALLAGPLVARGMSTVVTLFSAAGGLIGTALAAARGVVVAGFTAMTTAILPILGRLNFMIHTFFTSVLPAVVSRGMAAATIALTRAMWLMNAVFAQGIPMMLTTMAAIMTGIQGIVVAGWAAINRAVHIAHGVMIATTAVGQRAVAIVVAAGQALIARIHMISFASILRGAAAFRTNFLLIFGILFGRLRTMLAGFGTFVATFGTRMIAAVRAISTGIAAAMTGPIGIAIALVVTLLIVFRKQIADIWGQVVDSFRGENSRVQQALAPMVKFFHALVDGIQRAFNRLPEGVQKAFLAVVRIVKAAVMKVYELFSWMRPEVRHSPSLIESVTNGMAEIRRQYASVGNAGAVFKKAASDLKAFKAIAASMGQDEWADKRADVTAAMPQGLAGFNILVKDLDVLNSLLGEQDALVSKQEAVVKKWSNSLKDANGKLDAQVSVLDGLKLQLQGLEDAYSAHEQAMNGFADSSIVGMGAMSDAIFENEIAQKKLRLEILKLGDAGGGADDLSSRLASLQGDIEALRGTTNDLRASGAGSDVLGPINDQIAQMEAAYLALEGAGTGGGGSATSALQAQLDELQRQAEILDLENALQFDPLLRQIDKVVDGTKELTFEEIIAGVKNEREAMDALKPSIDAATQALASQQAVVDSLTAARDAISKTYDTERDALSQLQDEYSFTADAIREIEAALNDVASAASSARSASGSGAGSMSPGAENFINAEGGNFENVGGDIALGRETMGDESFDIDQFTQDQIDETAKLFGDLDMFGPIKKLWNDFTAWWSANVVPAWNGMVDGLTGYFGSLDFSGLGDRVGEIGNWFSGVWDGVKEIWGKITDLFGPQLSEIWNKIKEGFNNAIGPLKEEFGKWGDMLKPLGEYFDNLWVVIKVGAAAAAAIITGTFSVAFSIIGNIIRPVIETIGQAFRSILQIVRSVVTGVAQILNGMVNIIKGIFNVIVGIFTLDGDRIKEGFGQIWEGMKQIVTGFVQGVIGILDGLWDMIYQTFKAAAEIVWGIISGFVEGIVDFFVWLWDVLVGHSIIPDLVEAIKDWFINMKDKVIDTVKDFVGGVIQWFKDLYNDLVQKVKDIWTAVTNKFNDIKTSLVAKVTEIYNSVTGWFSSVWTKLVEIVQGIWNSITGKFSELKNSLATKVSEIYTSVTGKFGEVRDKIGEVVETLKNNVSNKFTNIRDAMLGAFEWVRDKISGIFGSITSYIKTGINAAIGVVNGLISGLNKVADILPGLSWSISSIPLMAQGGTVPNQRVGGGFATNKARAIVGEGSNAHKEYVVPTDPRYRKRATGLYQQLGRDLGLPTDYDGLGIGGLSWDGIKSALGSAKDMLAEGADWVKDTAQGAVSKVFQPFKNTADGLISKLAWNFGKKTAQSSLDNMWSWVVGGDEAFRSKGDEAKAIQAANAAWKRPMSTYTLSSGFGYRRHPITGVNKLHAGIDMAAATGTSIFAAASGMLRQMVTAGGLGKHVLIDHGAGLKTQYGHMSAFVGGPGQVTAGQLIGRVGSTGASTGPHLHFEIYKNGIPTDPVSYMAGKGLPLASVAPPRNLVQNGAGSMRMMAKGGIVRSQPGGIIANIGEGKYDEAVIPLPNGWQGLFDSARNISAMPSSLTVQRLVVTGALEARSSALEPQTVTNNTITNNYHFHGDLSFPNIKDGDDAEMFLTNLGTYAGGGPRG